MKKIFMMIALMAVPFAMQAQAQFHDVEANEAKGAVKCIKMNMMGNEQVTTFDQNGKMLSGMTDAKYDENGYLQSAKREMMGQSIDVKFKWADGRLAGQVMNMMGNDMEMKYNYNEQGVIAEVSMDMGGQEMKTPYTDYKFDEKGNWISRKMDMMGQTMEQTRTIEYFE